MPVPRSGKKYSCGSATGSSGESAAEDARPRARPDRSGGPEEQPAAKKWPGNRDRPGRTWRPSGSPVEVDCHTFITRDQPVVIPFGSTASPTTSTT